MPCPDGLEPTPLLVDDKHALLRKAREALVTRRDSIAGEVFDSPSSTKLIGWLNALRTSRSSADIATLP
jgi:hypothetical protein